jgi:hypothetical protein
MHFPPRERPQFTCNESRLAEESVVLNALQPGPSPLIVCRFSGRGTPSFRSLTIPQPFTHAQKQRRKSSALPKGRNSGTAETTEMIAFAFLIFRNASKYACQAQKPPKHIKTEGIELAF